MAGKVGTLMPMIASRLARLSRLSSRFVGIGVVCAAAILVLAATSRNLNSERASISIVDRFDSSALDERVDFNRDIRPILSNNCYACHGPDGGARKAGLRFDIPEAPITPNKDGQAAIVPGHVDQSLMVRRITAADPADRMPPAETRKMLSPAQIDLIRRWIEQGAEFSPHWSLLAPARAAIPEVSDPSWPRNAIDSFILHQLDERGLSPSPEADKARLLRRVTLDLTGLPPTIEELDSFLADESPDAYERIVDALLQSSRYGEHMARFWLDAARFGDTHGLHLDNYRDMWRWRDWVIDAFNANMPFDRFTIEQLAGDLLPEPTLEQLIATGFNRNNVTTNEGGAIAEEYLVKYAVDRVETTSTVWMGLTAGCAACHDHKFDPLTQKEFYQLLAFFNNVDETGLDGNQKDPPPIVRAATPQQREQLAALAARVAAIEEKIAAPDPVIDSAQAQWESTTREEVARWWRLWTPAQIVSTAGSTLTLLDDASVLAGGANPGKDDYILVGGTDLQDIRLVQLEALTHPTLPHTGPGRADNANFVLSEIELVAVSKADPMLSRLVRFRRALADFSQEQGGFPVTKAIDTIADDDSGWAVAGYERRENRTAVFLADEPFGFAGGTELRFLLRHQSKFAQHGIGRVRLALSTSTDLAHRLDEPTAATWHEAGPFKAQAPSVESAAAATFEPEANPAAIDLTAPLAGGAIQWIEKPDYVDGAVYTLSESEYAATYLYRTVESPDTRTVVISLGSDDACVLWVNGRKVLEQLAPRAAAPDQNRVPVELEAAANHILLKVVNFAGGHAFYFKMIEGDAPYESARTLQALSLDPAARTAEQNSALRTLFRRQHSPESRSLFDALDESRQELAAFEMTIPTTLIMKERSERRMTNVLNRGNYDQPKDAVEPGVPACLPPLPDRAPADRMTFARWLVAPDHPLTARVTVNRLWQQMFGVGLVETSEDFGSQGSPPTHPELLDWLAVEFAQRGWDIKHMLRLMVTSATYRQTSRITPDRQSADPRNRFYSRGPRYRMDAEMIRDFALHTSGLLVEQIGGPSVRPYQPEGLWEAVAYPDSDTRAFKKDEGEAQYRRSLYTFWKRTQPPPNLATFDAPSRESCAVRRPRTNTPLQMLALMNDPQFVEASRALGERIMLEGGASEDARMRWAFRLATAREPRADEIDAIRSVYHEQLARFRESPQDVAALLSVGDHMVNSELDRAELAAWTTIANILLSLDESITKG